MKSFLIVEDDDGLRDLYESLIRKKYKNIHIDHAANGGYALKKAKEIDYTVIIIDIDLPVMSGADFYKKLKEKNPELTRRTVFISGGINNSGYEFIFEESRPHLVKPFAKDDFFKLISYVISKEEETFLSKYARPCRRNFIRSKAKEGCILEFKGPDSYIMERAICKSINYSIDGLAVIYKKDVPILPDYINISVNKFNILNRPARLKWTKQLGSENMSGLQWE